MPLNLQQSKIFDIYERLFAEEGWQELTEDLKEKIGSLKESMAYQIDTAEQLHRARGIIQGYEYIVNLKRLMEDLKAQASDE